MKKTSLSDFHRWFKEAIFAIVLFVLFALVIYFAKDIKLLVLNTTIDARFWPKVCGISGCVFCFVLLIQSIVNGLKLKNEEESGSVIVPEKADSMSKRDNLRTFVTLSLTLLYVVGLSVFGFIISTAVYLLAIFLLLSEKEGRKIWKLAVIDITFTVVVYLIFQYVFKMMLPTGSIW